ncbi:hypothetical protein QQY66_48380 [Streptomyces sp. DG2A-72]|uniref:hypothetical protein n=1 Tax=Streptomyces sp. DG2A-72 TaxID=3051386 RepID=UPI00265C74CA|nr:hypothetical protein [Streptomyces sp. DG2A-72]MDO0939147.1 hypothetical protein [Streptomyces sp. DG2A-72]
MNWFNRLLVGDDFADSRLGVDSLDRYLADVPDLTALGLGPITDDRCAVFPYEWRDLRFGFGFTFRVYATPDLPEHSPPYGPYGVGRVYRMLCTPDTQRRWTDAALAYADEISEASKEFYAAAGPVPYVEPWSLLRFLRTGHGRPAPPAEPRWTVPRMKYPDYRRLESRYEDRVSAAEKAYAPVRTEIENLVEEAEQAAWERARADEQRRMDAFAAEAVWLFVMKGTPESRTCLVFRHDVPPRMPVTDPERRVTPMRPSELDVALRQILTREKARVAWDPNAEDHVRNTMYLTIAAHWGTLFPDSPVFPKPPVVPKPPTARGPGHGPRYSATSHHSSYGIDAIGGIF